MTRTAPDLRPQDRRSRKVAAGIVAVCGIGVVGCVDFLTGVEYRVYPLYFVPVIVAAWHLRLPGTIATTALATAVWGVFNYAAGMQFESPGAWAINLVTQATATGVVGVLIVRLQAAIERVTSLSRTDPLTALPNSRAFGEIAGHSFTLARRYGHPITLAYIDLDGFKSVNDTLGHHAGDDMLQSVAGVLRESLRDGDTPARLGGDEFAVLLPETDVAGAETVLGRLHARLGLALSSSPGPVTASIGAVTLPRVTGDLDDLIREADAVMYAAKSEGKNRVRIEVSGDAARPGP